jgi:hypothetical protein
VGTGFPKRSCSNNKLERDGDSKISHPALEFFLTPGTARIVRVHAARPTNMQRALTETTNKEYAAAALTNQPFEFYR